jgi:hypothetical protein
VVELVRFSLRTSASFTARLVSSKLDLVARLRIDLLRPQEPGALVSVGDDIDNRVKTLLDALRIPKTSDELPRSDVPRDGETPFRLLAPGPPEEVFLLIRVHTVAELQAMEIPSAKGGT